MEQVHPLAFAVPAFGQVQRELAAAAPVGAYLTGQAIANAVSKVTSAYERCVRAEREADAGEREL